MPPSPSIAVVGAGLSGLAAAHRLRQRGRAVTVYEAAEAPGGVVATVRGEGFLADLGPNTMQTRHTAVRALLQDLGLWSERVLPAPGAANRYVVRGGAVVALPASPRGALKTRVLSPRGKLRVLREPFVRRSADPDESLADLVRRRLGPEVLDYAVAPFVGGVWAGDPERLSARHAFPLLTTLEAEHGSLLRGLLARRRPEASEPVERGTYSFRDGLSRLVDRLARAVGPDLRTGARVRSLSRDGDAWIVGVMADGRVAEARHAGVVLTVPLWALGRLALPFETGSLQAVPYPPLSVLALGFRRTEVAHPLDGFGVLLPPREGKGTLGVLFSSSLFPDRAPEGHVLLTAFVGGRLFPEQATRPPDAVLRTALQGLGPLLGLKGDPVFVRHRFWPHAIPQYEVGYEGVLGRLAALEGEHPGLRFAGNFRGGVAVADALKAGLDAADAL